MLFRAIVARADLTNAMVTYEQVTGAMRAGGRHPARRHGARMRGGRIASPYGMRQRVSARPFGLHPVKEQNRVLGSAAGKLARSVVGAEGYP